MTTVFPCLHVTVWVVIDTKYHQREGPRAKTLRLSCCGTKLGSILKWPWDLGKSHNLRSLGFLDVMPAHDKCLVNVALTGLITLSPKG